jgi:hypothetical protein
MGMRTRVEEQGLRAFERKRAKTAGYIGSPTLI